MSDNKEEPKKDVDPELDELLNSALQDMIKKPDQPESTKAEDPQNMSEEIIKEAAAQLKINKAAILGNFSGVPEAAAPVMKPGNPAPVEGSDPNVQVKIDEVSTARSQTQQTLNTNTQGLQNPLSEQDLANMYRYLRRGALGGAQVSTARSQTQQTLNTNTQGLQNPLSEQDLANMYRYLRRGALGGAQVSTARSQTQQTLNTNTQGLQNPLSAQDLANMYRYLRRGALGGAQVLRARSQTLQTLNTITQVLQNTPSEQDVANMYRYLSMGALGGAQGENMMQGLLQALLPKEVLNPARLDNNKRKIEEAEYQRFNQQHELMEVSELEPGQESAPDDVKRKRIENQDLGQPPTELVIDVETPPAEFAPPDDDEQSSVL